jgi:hypothetical protein
LELELADGRARLRDGDELVAEGQPVEADWEVPEPVPLEVARAAVEHSLFLERPRPFVSCFVCGPDRPEGDGLEIYVGSVAERKLMAATWTPDESVADTHGRVRPEIVWAALDCPTSGPVANWRGSGRPERPIVLARHAVDIQAPVEAGREHVVLAWPIEIDGRKRHSGSALFTADGELLASARALWIELRDSPGA